MSKKKVAILISGRGSNMEALIKACQDATFPASIELVISNKKEAYGLKIELIAKPLSALYAQPKPELVLAPYAEALPPRVNCFNVGL